MSTEKEMYAVIDKSTDRIIRAYNSRDAAIVACQMEKEKLPIGERKNITAVALDDGGYMDII